MIISELGDNWHSAYESCLQNYEVLKAAAIARYYRPAKLYKYYSFSSEYWRKNVFDTQIAFNTPFNFNDPFDSKWFLDYEKIYRSRFENLGIEWTKEAFGGEHLFNCLCELHEEDLLHLQESCCICCFSESPHSNLMWGHYADKHQGFCLEYDISLFPHDLSFAMPVIYTKKPFDASILVDKKGLKDQYARYCPLLFKSSDWAYEKEWRIILKNQNYTVPYIRAVSGAITGVFFGFRAYGKDREELEAWSNANNIPTYQIERSYLSFDFISERISDIQMHNRHEGLLFQNPLDNQYKHSHNSTSQVRCGAVWDFPGRDGKGSNGAEAQGVAGKADCFGTGEIAANRRGNIR